MLIASGVNCVPNLALKGLAASQFGHHGLVFHFLLSGWRRVVSRDSTRQGGP